MPAPYSKPSQQLIWDLINKSNPQLRIPLSDANCVIYGYPVSQTPSAANGQRNTRIRLYAKQGMGYKGELTVNYNRLSLASLFTGFTPTVTNYAANSILNVVAAFNSTYGLSLIYGRSTADSQPTWTLGMTIPDVMANSGTISGAASSDNLRAYTATPESLCWTGSINIQRYRGNPDLSTLITQAELQDARRVPQSEAGLLNVPLITYGYDFTDYKADIANLIGSSSNQTYRNRIASILSQVTGLEFLWSSVSTNANLSKLDLYTMSLSLRSVAMGSRDYYNTEDFNRCLVLYTATSYGTQWNRRGYGILLADQDVIPTADLNVGVFMHFNE